MGGLILPAAAPETQGVPSGAILGLIEAAREAELPLHSLLIARHGKLICEAYWSPFTASTLHRMFSETKSLVSIAVGCLCAERGWSLNDTLVSVFPDVPNAAHLSPELRELTLRDTLRMATPYLKTTYKADPDGDWVRSFFTVAPSRRAGSGFAYDTSAAHTLCALVERSTGQSMLEYLRGKCLDEIGFSKAAYCLKDRNGVSMGGSGLMALPRDMLALTVLLANGGKFNDRQLLPENYIKQATACQISTAAGGTDGVDFRQGYGYQFWRLRHNAWCMYGMGGQFSIYLPDRDLVIVTTADTQGIAGGTQMLLDLLWRYLLPALTDTPLPPSRGSELLKQKLAGLKLPCAENKAETSHGSYACVFGENGLGLRSARFSLGSTGGELALTRTDGQTETIAFGIGRNKTGFFTARGAKEPCVASGGFQDRDTFLIRVQLAGERLGDLAIELTFNGSYMTIFSRCFEEWGFYGFDGAATGQLLH